MFEARLLKLSATLKAACELRTSRKPHFRGGHRWCAVALALSLMGSCAFATSSLASESSPFVQSSLLEGSLTLAVQSAAPVLSVSGETVSWTPVGNETYYEVAVSSAPRGAAGRSTRYLSVARATGETQSYSVALEPGQTAYVGVSADNSPNWSVEEATVTVPSKPSAPEAPAPKTPVTEPPVIEPPAPPVTEPPAVEPPAPPIVEPPIAEKSAPQLSVAGTTIHWSAVPGSSSYTLATILDPTTTRVTTYRVVTGTSYTPPAVPGQSVNYGLSASVPGEAPWAKEVTISYPASTVPPAPPVTPTPPEAPTAPENPVPPVPPTPPIAPVPSGTIIGTNDGAGWGEAPAKTILAGHITWNRVEIGAQWNTVPASLSDGFKVLAIVGNTANGTPLSQVEPNQWGAEVVKEIEANPGISIAEAGNEVYYKGGVANPVQYGKMYLAAVNATKAAGIDIRLLFNMWGDYDAASGFSSDSAGGGWLRAAVGGVPGLAAAIRANGLSTHPYGALTENYEDDGGVAAVRVQEAVAQTVLGAIPPFYVTEIGYAMSRCGASDGACSQQEQASKMQEAYAALLADPHVAGIWWFESHDDGEGEFGFMNGNNTTRPSFDVLSAIAQEQGQ